MPTYSIIIPIYNEEANIAELYSRLCPVMQALGDAELVLIDDGSRDHSLEIMRQLHGEDTRVSYLSFARNFGHQIAVTAGLNFARGQAVIVMDADLQDPPELLPQLVERWQQGYQVVYAQRSQRQREPWLKRFLAHWFYRILRHLADVEIPIDTGDFCLMDRRVVDLLNAMPERNRYIRGLRAWVGYRQTAVRFDRAPRHAGSVKYTFSQSLALAINSLVGFSKVPLRLSTYLGLAAGAVSLMMSLLVLYWRFFAPSSPLTGYTIITVVVFFLGAVQLISIGILGEYIGRIYEEIKGRPLYTLSEVGGFQAHDRQAAPQKRPEEKT